MQTKQAAGGAGASLRWCVEENDERGMSRNVSIYIVICAYLVFDGVRFHVFLTSCSEKGGGVWVDGGRVAGSGYQAACFGLFWELIVRQCHIICTCIVPQPPTGEKYLKSK